MAVLTSTGVTFSDSTSQASAYIGGRGQVFTSSGTFTVPAGVTAIRVTVVGAGGGSGGAAAGSCDAATGGAGGGGGAAIEYITGLTPGGTHTVTVGTGGTAGGSGNSAGGAGGTSSFAAFCSATGGGGGGGGNNNTGSTGSNGTGSGGDINLSAFNPTGVSNCAPIFGGTVPAPGANTNGIAAINRGSGASGAKAQGSGGGGNNRSGAAGSAGIVVIEF